MVMLNYKKRENRKYKSQDFPFQMTNPTVTHLKVNPIDFTETYFKILSIASEMEKSSYKVHMGVNIITAAFHLIVCWTMLLH